MLGTPERALFCCDSLFSKVYLIFRDMTVERFVYSLILRCSRSKVPICVVHKGRLLSAANQKFLPKILIAKYDIGRYQTLDLV